MRPGRFLLAVPLVCLLETAFAGGPRIVSYEISARLDTKARAIQGSETLTWLNTSAAEVSELRFHLYMNAFRNDRSTFLREGGVPDRLKDGGWGWIDVRRMQIAGGADLTKSIHFVHPDDDNADDRTVASVPLPRPVKPGQSITLQIDFYTRLPHVVSRTGYHGDFYMAGQWFPKIGVLQPAGWNCHQFHANSEFFADYGRYSVTLTTPSDYVVGATGVLESRRDDAAANTTTRTFVQEDVHDFAWTASPRFLRIERTFDPAREVSARELAAYAALEGIPEVDAALRPVRMILLIQPEHADQIERHFRALSTGLKYFGLMYGAYPYRTITVVDPPFGGGQAGGMEYPTLITAGTNWHEPEHTGNPEMVIVHEFGHQFWYGMVGNNEFEEAWLDEGINSYSTSKILDKVYGSWDLPVRPWGLPVARWAGLPRIDWDQANRMAYLFLPKSDSIVRNAWEFYNGTSYGLNSYMHPALMLRTLERVLGEPVMARVMRTYQQRWRYRHPATPDFIAVVNEVSGRDMKPFFDQFLYGSNILDYKVGDVSSNKKGKIYESTVKIRREGEAVWPVDIRIRFKNGRVENRQWDGAYRWVKYEFTGPAAIESVEIDPEHKLLLDVNFANNSYRAEPAYGLAVKWAANVLSWVQNLLLAASSLS